jgi:phospholipid transport system transporter-binding protein
MIAEVNLNEDASCLTISGVLNVDTVVRLRELGTALLKTMPEATIDLQKVTECDSAALALLTALARDAKKIGKQARFIHVPSQLMAIAKLSALDKVLTL